MTLIRTLLTATMLAAGSAPAQIPIPPPPPPPMVAGADGERVFTDLLIEMVPGPVRCGDEPVEPVALERPFPTLIAGGSVSGSPVLPEIATLSFRIDETGRPLGIARRARLPGSPPLPIYLPSEDIVPAFAASRFPARARTECRVSVEARLYPAATAPLPLVRRYLVSPRPRVPAARALFSRIHPADTTCLAGGGPPVRLRAYPDFDAIPQASGTWSYAMAGFDIDAKGSPSNVRIVGSDGNAALDRETIAAVKQSRFAPEARKGCTHSYYRRSTRPLEAPDMPRDRFTADKASCPDEGGGAVAGAQLRFPPGFERRSIEGWAIIGYDLAPWGQAGNVRVLAAEPADAFGVTAQQIVMGTRGPQSASGRSGCVQVVRFKMPPRGAGNEDHGSE